MQLFHIFHYTRSQYLIICYLKARTNGEKCCHGEDCGVCWKCNALSSNPCQERLVFRSVHMKAGHSRSCLYAHFLRHGCKLLVSGSHFQFHIFQSTERVLCISKAVFLREIPQV